MSPPRKADRGTRCFRLTATRNVTSVSQHPIVGQPQGPTGTRTVKVHTPSLTESQVASSDGMAPTPFWTTCGSPSWQRRTGRADAIEAARSEADRPAVKINPRAGTAHLPLILYHDARRPAPTRPQEACRPTSAGVELGALTSRARDQRRPPRG